jgi:hypothetical protein
MTKSKPRAKFSGRLARLHRPGLAQGGGIDQARRYWQSRLGARLLLPQQQGTANGILPSRVGPTPRTFNWDKWQEPVHDKQAFNAEAYIRWRKYYPYCAGLLGDLAPHRLLPLMLATGNPEFPTRVVSLGTKPVHADATPPAIPNAMFPNRSKSWPNSPAA